MNENDESIAQFGKWFSEDDVNRTVSESAEMNVIRHALEDKGLDPIWARLIAEFGTLMYARGRRARVPPSRRVSAMH